MAAPSLALTRRAVLAGGGALVVHFALGQGGGSPPRPPAPAEAEGLPGSLAKQPLLDGWIRIDGEGRVTAFTGKAELGQGLKTALVQVVAEELQVAPARITLVTADTARTANEGYTAGSHSMQDSGTALRHAAAQVRDLLVGLAAQRLGVASDQLAVRDGVVEGGGARAAYGELVAGEVLHVAAAPQSTLRPHDRHTVMGKPLARIDIPAKVTGGAAYVHDLRLPGMVHGRVVRPPGRGAMLRSVDVAAVARRPGVLKVVRDGRFLGVVAEREWQAVEAARALAAAAQWDVPPGLPPAAGVWDTLRASATQDTTIAETGAGGADTPGLRWLEASYRRPFQMHASIGPSCAIARFGTDEVTVWTHSQGVFPLRGALAELLKVAPARIRCIHVEGAGCYGHNGADDVAADAVLLGRALPGRPVRVQWMREDEHGWEPLGPPMVASARAALDGAGRVARWQYEVWSPPHSTRPGAAGDLLAAQHLAEPFPPTPPKPLPQPEGGGDRNAIPLYAFPALKVVHHFQPTMVLRSSAQRGLGAYLNVFALESFMDELARAAQADPVAFRLAHLQDERAAAVVRLAAERFGWSAFQRRAARGRGFGFARYKNLGAYCAIACEVEAWRESGEVRLVRAVAAVDSGEAVNPDGIRNQIEGGIVQSTSWTCLEEVGFDRSQVTTLDWGGYPILRFAQVPARIDVHVLDRPGQPFLGTGEAAQGPAAAAIANALADATGTRVRDLPLSRARVRAAVG